MQRCGPQSLGTEGEDQGPKAWDPFLPLASKELVFWADTRKPTGHNATVCNWQTHSHCLGSKSQALLPGIQDRLPFMILSHFHAPLARQTS